MHWLVLIEPHGHSGGRTQGGQWSARETCGGLLHNSRRLSPPHPTVYYPPLCPSRDWGRKPFTARSPNLLWHHQTHLHYRDILGNVGERKSVFKISLAWKDIAQFSSFPEEIWEAHELRGRGGGGPPNQARPPPRPPQYDLKKKLLHNASTTVEVTRGERRPSERWGSGETSRSQEDLEKEQSPSERWGSSDLKSQEDLKGCTVPLHNVLFLYNSVQDKCRFAALQGYYRQMCSIALHCLP